MRVKIGGKPIPASFLNIEGRGTIVGTKDRGEKEMSGEERLPEERWRKVGVSGSLRGSRSEEMTQSNTSFPLGSEVPFESQRG